VSLVSLEPLAVVLAAWALQRIRPTALEQAGVVTATAGAVLIARGAGSGAHRIEGDLLVLAAVVLYGLYIAAARAWRGALPPTRYAALVYAVAAVVSACALPFAASVTLPPHAVWAILLLALVPTLVGHTLVQAAAQSVPPAIVALVSPGETLGGLLISALVLGATPQPIEMVGAAVVIAGATIAILGTTRSSG
jgi:drug/metabolite transporter (DMT)-like permease